MRINLLALAAVIAGFILETANAQPGQPPTPSLDGAMAKLFGDNTGFSATMEFHIARPSGNEMLVPGKINFLDGKSRFDVDLSNLQGSQIPPQAVAHMKQMGMGRLSTITLPDKKLTYLVYPDMQAYLENPGREAAAGGPSDFKMEATKLGEETIDGHNCVKNKVVVTAADGSRHESLVWNASDLNQFPLKIQVDSGNGPGTVLLFKDVKLNKPETAQFDLPANYTKYNDMMGLMMSGVKGARSK